MVLIGLGSNIDPEKNITAALSSLEDLTCLKDRATIWQTPAVGGGESDYLNTAVLVETTLALDQFKVSILSKIENSLGRIREIDKYADRTIDLDILAFGNQIIGNELWQQPHVTIPAAEILPDLVNPDSGESLSQAAIRFLPGINFIERNDL
jgi:2-amino-4-hydroxy-6-hydroxymethyldihydropteridine diphosphokinase